MFPKAFAGFAAIAFGAFLTLHQPASAGTLETATAGNASWTYTAGATGRTYNFAPIQGTDWSRLRTRLTI